MGVVSCVIILDIFVGIHHLWIVLKQAPLLLEIK